MWNKTTNNLDDKIVVVGNKVEDIDVGVASFNGSKGDITYTPPVTSVNGSTGAVTITSVETSTKWNGSAKTVSTSSPSGGSSGDIWFQYIA